jgi:hypothetical protein
MEHSVCDMDGEKQARDAGHSCEKGEVMNDKRCGDCIYYEPENTFYGICLLVKNCIGQHCKIYNWCRDFEGKKENEENEVKV